MVGNSGGGQVYFGLVNKKGGVNYYTLDNALSQCAHWIDLEGREDIFKQRLEFLVNKVKAVEDIHFKYPDDSALKAVLWDLGGQSYFYHLYDKKFSMSDAVLFLMDYSNGFLDSTELDQLRDLCDNVSPKSSYSYALSKSDIGYLMDCDEDGKPKDLFTLNLKNNFISRYEDADMIMPICIFDSFDADGVLAIIGGLLLRHFDPSRGSESGKRNDRVYIFSIAGRGMAGKSSLINRYESIIVNNKKVTRKTKQSNADAESESIYVYSSMFYAHDKDHNMYFVNDAGDITNYIKVSDYLIEEHYFDRFDELRRNTDCRIKSFVLYDSEYDAIQTYDGSDWGKVLESLYNAGSSPVYDLKIISRIAQFMVPSKWGFDSPDSLFPDSKEFIKNRYEQNKSIYEEDLSFFTT